MTPEERKEYDDNLRFVVTDYNSEYGDFSHYWCKTYQEAKDFARKLFDEYTQEGRPDDIMNVYILEVLANAGHNNGQYFLTEQQRHDTTWQNRPDAT